jgi:hypothetical protein
MGDLFDDLSHQFIHLKMERYLYNYYEKKIYPPETLHPSPYREHPGGWFHHQNLSFILPGTLHQAPIPFHAMRSSGG